MTLGCERSQKAKENGSFSKKKKCRFSWREKKEKILNTKWTDPLKSDEKRKLEVGREKPRLSILCEWHLIFKSCYLSIVSSYSSNSLWMTKIIYRFIVNNVTVFCFTSIVRKKMNVVYYPSLNDQVCFMNPIFATVKIHFCERFLKIRWNG